MKYKKLLILPILALLFSGCSCNIQLYTPDTLESSDTTQTTPEKINIINESNYNGTITYAPSNQDKLTLEDVYKNGVTSTVYIVSTVVDTTYLGSGVVFSEDPQDDGYAYIFTNAHVVENANNVEIIYSNNKRDKANIVGYHVLEDIAILSVKKNDNYTIATLKTSDKLNVASEVLTIGTPISTDYSFSSTSGIISKIDSPLASTLNENYDLLLLQIDATLNSGNSGGPLFDTYGNLIGLNTMKIIYDDSYNSVDNFNFAIPIERAVFIANKIFNNTPYNRGLLGITITDIVDMSLAQRDINNVDLEYGLYVHEVVDSSASYQILLPGDIIIKINNIEFKTKTQFQKELYNYSKEETIALTVYRENTYINVNIVLK